MDYLDISKFLTAIAVSIATVLSNYIYSILTHNGGTMKFRAASIELIDKMMNEREWEKRENRIVIEEAFTQLYSKPLSFDEIKTLVYADTPNAAFKTYLKYRPALEFNSKKTKFRFKNNKRPYWLPFETKRKIPKSIAKGALLYTLLAFPASYGMTWLLGDTASMLGLGDIVVLWLLDLLIWLAAIVFLLEGIKYQDSEKDILTNFGDKFEVDSRVN